MHANRAVVMQLTYPRRTLAPDIAPGHGTLPPPLESPFLQRLDPATVQASLKSTDVGRWDSAEESPGEGAAGNQASQKLAAEDTKCVMLCFQCQIYNIGILCLCYAYAVPVLCYAMLCYVMLCFVMLCCVMLCCDMLCCAMPFYAVL